MKPSADDLWAIWNSGKAIALAALLRGDTSGEKREEILFSAWSEALGQMMAIMPEEDNWKSLSKEEMLEVLKGKTFSLQNFQKSIIDGQFELIFEQDLPY